MSQACVRVAAASILVALTFLNADLPAQVQPAISAAEIVHQMVESETLAWQNREPFAYTREERSNRTKGHLWRERIVETSDGPMRWLLSVDGKPLSISQVKAEDKRMQFLVDHPSELRRQSQRQNEDQARMPELLKTLPNIFLFRILSGDGVSTRIEFEPNPTFQEKSYQDRIVHAMAGVMLLHASRPGAGGKPVTRLCNLQVHMEHPVEFGFGLIGEVNSATNFSLARQEVAPSLWKSSQIRVHLDGTVLMLKNISRDVEATQFDFQPIARSLTLSQAAALLKETPKKNGLSP